MTGDGKCESNLSRPVLFPDVTPALNHNQMPREENKKCLTPFQTNVLSLSSVIKVHLHLKLPAQGILT